MAEKAKFLVTSTLREVSFGLFVPFSEMTPLTLVALGGAHDCC
jgi:hypothetical protein